MNLFLKVGIYDIRYKIGILLNEMMTLHKHNIAN